MAVVFNPFTGDLQYLNPAGGTTLTSQDTDPTNPAIGDMWLLMVGRIGTAGQASGIMGLTYSREEVATYQFSVQTENGDIKRMNLI